MPKVSKASKSTPRTTASVPSNSKPPTSSARTQETKGFYCSRCGTYYRSQNNNFIKSFSPLYTGNGSYITVCNRCLDELLAHYTTALGNEAEAIERLCLKFDIYWNQEIYDMVIRENRSFSHMRGYISKSNLVKYYGKTYDNTLDEQYIEEAEREKKAERERIAMEEEYRRAIKKAAMLGGGEDQSAIDEIIEQSVAPGGVSQKMLDFWGLGFDNEFYIELDRKYRQWTDELPQPPDKGEEAIYKQVCILEATINRDSAAGKPIEKNISALNALLGSANLKPSQKKDESDVAFDNMSFGQGIRMYENYHPIPQPDPEMRDVDGIIRYISIWFLGHLCKMLNIKNTYCKMYEEEIEKMRIENPELEEEDDETIFNDIFGSEE